MSVDDSISKLFEELRNLGHRSEGVEIGKQILAESKTLNSPNVLLTYLQDQHWQNRYYAAEALEYFEEPEVARHLIEQFERETEEDEEVQAAIVVSLRSQKSFLALQVLIEYAKKRTLTEYVRSEAIFSIAVLTVRNVIDPLFQILTGPIKHSEQAVVGAIFDAFEWLEDSEDGIPAKLTALLRSSALSENKLTSALHYLGLRRYEPAFDVILAYLDNDDFTYRWAAADVLGMMGDSRALPKLMAMLDDPNKHVRHVASNSIQKLRSQSEGYTGQSPTGDSRP